MTVKIFESRRSILRGIAAVVFVVLFFGLIGTVIIFVAAPQSDPGKRIGLTLLGIGSWLVSLIFLWHYLKEAPKVTITIAGIRIKSLFVDVNIPFHEIEKVELAQKSELRVFFHSTDMESTIIRSKNHGNFVLWDHYYGNSTLMKAILQKLNDLLEEGQLEVGSLLYAQVPAKQLISKVSQYDVRLEKFTTYQGNLLLNWNTLIILGSLVPAILFVDKLTIGVILVFLLPYGLFGYQSHYFMVSDKYLRVRNYLWFRVDTTYRLEDIREVVIETPEQLARSARVVLKDFSFSVKPAGSLRTKDWSEFMNDLGHKGVPIRDDDGLSDE